GRARGFREDGYGTALSSAIQALRTTGAADATILLGQVPVKGRDTAWKLEQAVLAVMEGAYRFDTLKSKPDKTKRTLKEVAFNVEDRSEAAAAKAAIARATAIAEGITLAKDLGNLPGNVCTPTYLAEQARDLGARHGFKVEILERKDMEKLGMGAFLAVSRGSPQPPKLIVMEYHGGTRGAPPVALVGKGITFD